MGTEAGWEEWSSCEKERTKIEDIKDSDDTDYSSSLILKSIHTSKVTCIKGEKMCVYIYIYIFIKHLIPWSK